MDIGCRHSPFPQTAYKSLQFQARPVFQVGHHVRTAAAVLCSFGT